jgi:hypothetical protein
MSKNPGAPLFESAMRGYERNDVDAAVAALVSERLAFEKRAEELEAELASLQQATAKRPGRAASYLEVCRRVEGLLLGADEEARRAEDEAATSARGLRESAQAAYHEARARGEAYEAARLARAEEAAEKMLADAHADAARIRAEGDQTARDLAAGAVDLVEHAKAESVRLATEYETKSAAAREQFERDVIARQAAADQALVDAQNELAKAKAETGWMPDDLKHAAEVLIESARAAATELVTQSAARADSLRLEAERELAALMARRESINARLSSGRGAMSGRSGEAVAHATDRLEVVPAQGPAEEPTPEAAPEVGQAEVVQAEVDQAEVGQAEVDQAEVEAPSPSPEVAPEPAPAPVGHGNGNGSANGNSSVPQPTRTRFARLHAGSRPSNSGK